MPGIDRQRVVGKDDEELDELICSICQDIFEEPVVTQCCRQSFCTICINQWLVDNNTCPNDRKRLTINGLTPASRMVTNLLNKLNIKCVNYGNGCQSIVRFEEMANHMKTCKTSQKLSEKQKKIQTLERENEKLRQELIELKASNPISEESEAEAINNARSISNPIKECIIRMTEDEVIYLTNLAKTALSEECCFGDVSMFIYDNITDKPEYKQINWTIKTDFRGRTSIATHFNKGIDLTFNGVTIVFMGYKPK